MLSAAGAILYGTMGVERFARSGLSLLGSGYYRLRARPFVWRLLNRRPRHLWRRQARSLLPPESALVSSLLERGIAVGHLDELLPRETFAELARFARARWESSEVQAAVRERMASPVRPAGRKSFLVNLWPGEPLDRTQDAMGHARAGPMLELEHPFIRFSLSEPILAVVNAYLGMFAKFRFWHLEATIPLHAAPLASQRWHRDPEDSKLVKVFLYLNDVPEVAGPFLYLAGSHAGGRWQGLFPVAPPRGSLKMPPDENRFIPQEDVVVSTGRAGTLIFCDTTGLHRGGLARTSHRLMYTGVYTSSASPWPIRYTYPSGFSPQGLSPAQHFAVENNPRQREPRFYR